MDKVQFSLERKNDNRKKGISGSSIYLILLISYHQNEMKQNKRNQTCNIFHVDV